GISRPSVLAVLRLMTSSIWSVARSGPRRHDAALIEAFKGGGHARSGQLLGAPGLNSPYLLNVAAPRASVGQMEATSHDPFATLAGCGCGRIGCPRRKLAGNGVCSGTGAAARERCSYLPFRQLSRRSARGWSARCRGGGVLLPRRAAR